MFTLPVYFTSSPHCCHRPSIAAHAILLGCPVQTPILPSHHYWMPLSRTSCSILTFQPISSWHSESITDQQLFTSMDETAVELKKTCNEMFGVDMEKYGFFTRRNTQAHGQPVQFLASDWVSLVVQFKQRFGMTIHDTMSDYEAFGERFHDGTIEAERLGHGVSIADERQQVRSKPEPRKTMGMHVDASLTLFTGKRYMSVMPTNYETSRTVYRVMTNFWLLASISLVGLSTRTSPRTLRGHCMDCKYQLRREAIRLCREQGFGIQKAMWAA